MHAATLDLVREMIKQQAWSLRNELYRHIQDLKRAGLNPERDEKLLRELDCGGNFYSAWERRHSQYLECMYCKRQMKNPYCCSVNNSANDSLNGLANGSANDSVNNCRTKPSRED